MARNLLGTDRWQPCRRPASFLKLWKQRGWWRPSDVQNQIKPAAVLRPYWIRACAVHAAVQKNSMKELCLQYYGNGIRQAESDGRI